MVAGQFLTLLALFLSPAFFPKPLLPRFPWRSLVLRESDPQPSPREVWLPAELKRLPAELARGTPTCTTSTSLCRQVGRAAATEHGCAQTQSDLADGGAVGWESRAIRSST